MQIVCLRTLACPPRANRHQNIRHRFVVRAYVAGAGRYLSPGNENPPVSSFGNHNLLV
jgi:hypothetical protein